MSEAAPQFDVAVVGAGMVGACLAALLARAGFSVVMVESREPAPFDPEGPVGLRVSALSPGSASILAAAGAWPKIEQLRSCAYRRMQVEDAEHASAVQFDAAEFGLERLGTIVENDLVCATLWQLLRNQPLLQLRCPERVADWRADDAITTLALESGEELTARLVVAADGANSSLRALAGVEQQVWEYAQHGVVCVVRTGQPNPGIAWQRFMDGGPLAFLPLQDGQSSIVWTRRTGDAAALLELDDPAFIDRLSEASGRWLGGVRVCGPRASFPLAMRIGDRDIGHRLVLLGDAAHVVHPLAGQGVNLGLADAAGLVELLLARRRVGGDIGAHDLLRRYERWRRSENIIMAAGIHLLRGLHSVPATASLRGLGMGLVARSWLGREAFLRRAAGLGRNAPRLALGDGLETLMRQP